MMSTMYLAFGIELIALATGVGMLVWGLRNKGAGVTLAKLFGIIVMVLAALGLVCMGNSATKFMNHAKSSYMSGKQFGSKQGMMQNGNSQKRSR